jgi:hypothetical protein
MWFFSKFFSDEPGSADAPVIESDDSPESQQAPVIDYVLAMMETGKI